MDFTTTSKACQGTAKLQRCAQIFTPLEGVVSIETAALRLVQEFELKGISQNTQANYLRGIKKFAACICKTDNLRDATIYDVKNFIHSQRHIYNTASGTCNNYITAIKYLFTMVLNKEWNYDLISYSKMPKRVPNILTCTEVKKLIDAISDPMHRMIAIVMYSSGLRISEAIALRVSDIRSATMQIFVEQGKGRKDRFAILSKNCLNELRAYWKKNKPSNYLFPSAKFENNFVSRKTIETSISMAAAKVGVTATPHTLRHCFATHLIENNTDVFNAKEALGHASLKTTAKYIHLANLNGLNVKSPYDI